MTPQEKPAPPVVAEGVVDHRALMEAFSGMEPVMIAVINQFLKDYPVTLIKMKQGVEDRDFKSLKASSHSLKGMLAQLYAPSCEKLAGDLEQMAKVEKMAEPEAVFKNLQEKMKIIENELCEIKRAVPLKAA